MDELLKLQAELAAIQKAPSVFKLSEPNIVEVVQKLCELGLLDVLFTSNGKEYLTPKQLRNEVEDEVLAHGGRVNITELAPILNVDLPHIERAVDDLLKKDEGLKLFHGELITEYYLDSVAEEVNQVLQASGRVTLAELAVQYTLPTDFMMGLIEPRIGTIIQAKLAAGVLYTTAYVARHSARVRGVLTAVLRPTSLAALIREHGFNESLFHDCVDSLRSQGMLPGTVQGKSSYTPAVHAHAQVSGVKAFFEQNGVIEYAALSKMQVREPKAYLQSTFPGGIALESVYIKQSLLEACEVQVEEAVAQGWAVDVRSAFTHDLSEGDVEALLGASAPIKAALAAGRCLSLAGGDSADGDGDEGDAGGLLASASLISACAAAPQVDALVAATVQQRLQQPSAAKAAGAGASGESRGGKTGKGGGAGEDDEGGGKKAGKAGGGRAGKAAKREALLSLDGVGLDESDEEELSGKAAKGKGKKGKKGGKASGGGGGGGGSGGGDGEAETAGEDGDGGDSEALVVAIKEAIVEFKPALEEIDGLAAALSRHLFPLIKAKVEAELKAKREVGVSERRKLVQAAQETVSTLTTNVQLFAKGLASLDNVSPNDAELLAKALLKGACTDLVSALVRSEALHAGLEDPTAASSDGTLSATERKAALVALPGPPRRALEELEKAAAAGKTSAGVGGFLEALETCEETLGAHTAPLDKKREKAKLAEARAMYRQQLGAESEPSVVLHLCVVLLHLELGGRLLDAPGKLLLPLIESLQPKLSADAHGALRGFQRSVQATLQGGETAQAATEELRRGVDDIRMIGLSGGGKGAGDDAGASAESVVVPKEAQPAVAEEEPAAEPAQASPAKPKKKRMSKVD